MVEAQVMGDLDKMKISLICKRNVCTACRREPDCQDFSARLARARSEPR
jgi:hypothetical protein